MQYQSFLALQHVPTASMSSTGLYPTPFRVLLQYIYFCICNLIATKSFLLDNEQTSFSFTFYLLCILILSSLSLLNLFRKFTLGFLFPQLTTALLPIQLTLGYNPRVPTLHLCCLRHSIDLTNFDLVVLLYHPQCLQPVFLTGISWSFY